MRAIKDLVKPLLDEYEITYLEAASGTAVEFSFESDGKQFLIRVGESKVGSGRPVLSTSAPIVKFPGPDGELRALFAANYLNRCVPGGFVLSDDQSLFYALDLIVTDQMTTYDFKETFVVALNAVVGYYDLIMRIRFAKNPDVLAILKEEHGAADAGECSADKDEMIAWLEAQFPEG